ncbi:MAG: riboflavin synthase [Actinomycetota bacterium]|nr:riboflavin synthase [Actinomycetota bacterium]
MFTGIVEERGTVIEAGPSRLTVAASKVAEDSGEGSSIAVNGVCLTVAKRSPDETNGRFRLSFDVSPETLSRSSLGRLRVGEPVNLERPVTLMSRLGGHLVQGHVDGVGQVLSATDASLGKVVRIGLPDGLSRYVAEKGSVAIDGVSLTVVNPGPASFEVALVPHTLEVTTLGTLKEGDSVNVEVDVLAKYVEGLLKERS